VDPRFSHSHPVRICFRHKSHISQYLLNYIGRDQRYSEVNRNCQTFAADLFGFLAGKKGVEPFIYFQRIGKIFLKGLSCLNLAYLYSHNPSKIIQIEAIVFCMIPNNFCELK